MTALIYIIKKRLLHWFSGHFWTFKRIGNGWMKKKKECLQGYINPVRIFYLLKWQHLFTSISHTHILNREQDHMPLCISKHTTETPIKIKQIYN